MASQAIILHERGLTERESRLGRVLEFFGIPWKPVALSELESVDWSSARYAAFGSIQAVAAALDRTGDAVPCTAFFAYLSGDRSTSEIQLRGLTGRSDLTLQSAPEQKVRVSVTGGMGQITGPMSGLEFDLKLSDGDAVVASKTSGGTEPFAAIISAAGSPLFLCFERNGASVYVSASSEIIDIDQPVPKGFYDIKKHFCGAVPLMMFVRHAFAGAAWNPQELGACLIIDDPLLKPRYGFCDFPKLQTLMQGHRFNTNISFIPWNWRRTSPSAAEFFKRQAAFFSVSIHGCDHIAGEFGATSADILDARARLAQSRMKEHEARTGVHHDPVMVFPQGVFSSGCPEALKRNGFLAAVNTETLPVDGTNARTRVRDVWDVAIMSYGGFPVFTRRYAFHGVENFAFDLLLGKPCLIVSHHDFFKDGGDELLALVDRLHGLNCSLRWQSLGDVVRGACRRRSNGEGGEEIEMYGTELRLTNPMDRAVEVKVRKRDTSPEVVAQVFLEGQAIAWTTEGDYLVFSGLMPARGEVRFRLMYQGQSRSAELPQSIRYRISVAVRRILSEFRDDYLSRSRFLASTAATVKTVVGGRG